MNRIIRKNLRYYKRYYLLIALAVALANTIITGSLFVGDSVRHTLLSRVDERLGSAVTLITSGSGFMDDAFARVSSLKGAAATVFLTNGFVSHDSALQPVSVWGVDSSLTTIAAPDFVFPDNGEAVINRKIANELSLNIGDHIVLRLPNTSMIPSGSLFVTDNYTTSLRLRVKAIIDSRQSGNLNLRNEQSLPFNVFIKRQQLTSELEMDGKCNIIMMNRNFSEEELANSWTPDFSGIRVEKMNGYQEIVSEAVFLEKDLVSRLDESFPQTNRLFSYLVNSMINRETIPYSFVTAIDRFGGIELTGNDMILSDYAAKRMNAAVGDTVTLAFFVSAELKTLTEEKRPFVVRKIMPLRVFHADGRLSAEFPGLYDVDNCTDWDSDLPINMELITQEDEDYWDLWRTTPKALIAYSEGASIWGNNYGVATAVRIPEVTITDLHVSLSELLTASDAGITLVLPRETGLAAARGGVDFKSLFLSLAFFVIAAAMLLTTVPLGGMLHDRRKELQTLQALGYHSKRILNIILRELAVMTIAATFVGMFTAVLYNKLVLFALGNIWKGAVHTENFISSIEPASLFIGSMTSLIVCFAIVYFKIKNIKKSKSQKKWNFENLKYWNLGILVFLHVLIFTNVVLQSPVLYMITGLTALLAAISLYNLVVMRLSAKPFNRKSIIYKSLNYRMKNGVVSIAALACGVFVVLSVGLNRKSFYDASNIVSGTGGYALWGENSAPLYHSLSTAEGRARFGLSELPENTEILQFFRHGGDDASCLNLNKAPQPTVLGVDANILAKADFSFAKTKKQNSKKDESVESLNSGIFESLNVKRGDFYPVIADQTVLQWGLMKSVGDTITYINRKGEPVILQFVGGLDNSIFQGNLLMDKSFFVEIWGEDGSELMLIQTPDSTKSEVKQMLSQALANYGLQLELCNERLKDFNSVSDSYLTIFMMLGGLGLLIGLFGMAFIIKRGLLDRAVEISTLLSLGFDSEIIKKQLFRESMTVPIYAIAAGTVSALVAVASAIQAVSLSTWATMLVIIALLVLMSWWYTKRSFLFLALGFFKDFV